jgi:hypothetical protein
MSTMDDFFKIKNGYNNVNDRINWSMEIAKCESGCVPDS